MAVASLTVVFHDHNFEQLVGEVGFRSKIASITLIRARGLLAEGRETMMEEVGGGTKEGNHRDERFKRNEKEGRKIQRDGRGTSTGEGSTSIMEEINFEGRGETPTPT